MKFSDKFHSIEESISELLGIGNYQRLLKKLDKLMQSVDDINNKLDSLKSTLDGVDVETKQAVASVTTMQAQLVALQQQVADLQAAGSGASQAQLDQLAGKVDDVLTGAGQVATDVQSVVDALASGTASTGGTGGTGPVTGRQITK